jgi:hypothetical protein
MLRRRLLPALPLCLAACGAGLDDPNAPAVSSAALEGAKVVFATSTLYPAGRLGGLEGADQKCQRHAEGAGLPGAFKAWLSTEAGSPSTRFARATVPYVRVDGVRVADSYQAMVTKTSVGLNSVQWLLAPIDVTELGTLVQKSPVNRYGYSLGYVAFTGTRYDGTKYPSAKFCNGWTAMPGDAVPPTDGPQGGSTDPNSANSSGAGWTEFFGSGPGICDNLAPIYCFEQ